MSLFTGRICKITQTLEGGMKMHFQMGIPLKKC